MAEPYNTNKIRLIGGVSIFSDGLYNWTLITQPKIQFVDRSQSPTTVKFAYQIAVTNALSYTSSFSFDTYVSRDFGPYFKEGGSQSLKVKSVSQEEVTFDFTIPANETAKSMSVILVKSYT